jgi:UDP-glucose 4-epimerase
MHFFITGAAGFIGSNLADYLLAQGHQVTGYDNLSTGNENFIADAKQHASFNFIQGDVLNTSLLQQAMQGCDFVMHLQANADVRFGLNHPFKDIEQNTVGTFNVLEAMRMNNIKKMAFSSTGSVYGEAKQIPTPEDAAFPIQTSLYATSKVSGEGLISSYCEGFGFQAWIFRFVSILGERYSHGHVFDFYKKLLLNPNELEVLGNGLQRKSYLYIGDCIEAIMTAIEKANDSVNIFNLGTNEYCQVNDSIGWICESLQLKPILKYTGGERGWVGDNPFIFLDTKKIQNLGWKPKFTIQQGIMKTLLYLQQNNWLLHARD